MILSVVSLSYLTKHTSTLPALEMEAGFFNTTHECTKKATRRIPPDYNPNLTVLRPCPQTQFPERAMIQKLRGSASSGANPRNLKHSHRTRAFGGARDQEQGFISSITPNKSLKYEHPPASKAYAAARATITTPGAA